MNAKLSYQPHWVREDFVDFVLQKIKPTFAWKRILAEVIAVESLSSDMVLLTIKPNHNFDLIQVEAGKSVLITLMINGVYHQRSYSIVDVTKNGEIQLGIKVQGLVSKAAQQLRVGDRFEISQAQGDFVLHQGQQSALLIASGSGITAIYSLLKQAVAQNLKEIHVVYFNRAEVFHHEMLALAEQYPQLQYHFFNTAQQKQHLDTALLEKLVPNFKELQAYACGHHSMMRQAQEIYAQHDAVGNFHQEFFQPVQIEQSNEAQTITFRRAQQNFIATTNLLSSAEQAGLRPQHGCRMGVCNRCSCTKVSGVTQNVITGEIDDQPNRAIKLCVSQALSPVTIDL
ncbi:ferredoxin reductase [Acinetobacter sp. ANC 4805]|jgi:ferredoxin-NADP reductase|uniref:ferredoxin reductase n=1 Tax=Acinetobacter sp. ANC 4805 TaxID=2923425 RepID=UPI001F4A24A2|nr:ferredoxin reductase [Acinetobacter sp. ANC 4805]MCH7312359.1 ferredoxin reductase [Acinetobacter sp. ANC 4805]